MAQSARVLVIRCDRCNKRVLKYLKKGKGRLLRCLKDRIREDSTVRHGIEVCCPCGNRIGRDEGDHIKIYGSYRVG